MPTGYHRRSPAFPARPPAPAGAAPSVSLVYNSGAIDGMSQSRNNQPGWAGIGWELESCYMCDKA
jgi:hypothetical protein